MSSMAQAKWQEWVDTFPSMMDNTDLQIYKFTKLIAIAYSRHGQVNAIISPTFRRPSRIYDGTL